jgi:hypothetical protein
MSLCVSKKNGDFVDKKVTFARFCNISITIRFELGFLGFLKDY